MTSRRLHRTGFTAGEAATTPAAVLMDLIFSHRPLPDDTIPAIRSLLAARIGNRSFVSFAEAWNTVTGATPQASGTLQFRSYDRCGACHGVRITIYGRACEVCLAQGYRWNDHQVFCRYKKEEL